MYDENEEVVPTEIPYILCGQINLFNSPTATTELASYINFAMRNYRYENEISAGLRNDRSIQDNYKRRLKKYWDRDR